MMNDLLSYNSVVNILANKVPELRPVLDEHVRDQFGELLPHVFFGDLTRYVMEQVRQDRNRQPSDSNGVVARILEILEHALISGDEKLRELVVASFLENLDPLEDGYTGLKAILGPNLLHGLEAREDKSKPGWS